MEYNRITICDSFRYTAEWYTCIHPPPNPPLRPPHNSEKSFLCYTVRPCWLSILNAAVKFTFWGKIQFGGIAGTVINNYNNQFIIKHLNLFITRYLGFNRWPAYFNQNKVPKEIQIFSILFLKTNSLTYLLLGQK